MTARFKRNAEVLLLNEEEDDIQEDVEAESSLLSKEEDLLGEKDVEVGVRDGEDHRTLLSPTINQLSWWKSGRWKLWNHRKQYHVQSSTNKSKFCKVNSWKAVFIALTAFTMAMVISILLSRLLKDPPQIPATGECLSTCRLPLKYFAWKLISRGNTVLDW